MSNLIKVSVVGKTNRIYEFECKRNYALFLAKHHGYKVRILNNEPTCEDNS